MLSVPTSFSHNPGDLKGKPFLRPDFYGAAS
jgi:hypothetical protein